MWIIISTLRGRNENLSLLSAVREHGYHGRFVVAADDEAAGERFSGVGADLTIRPMHVAAGPLLDLLHQRDEEQAADHSTRLGQRS